MESLDRFFKKFDGRYYMFIAIILALGTVIIATLFYIQVDPTFTITTHYISHLGATPIGAKGGRLYLSAIVFSIGMAILVIFRILALLFLVRYFQIRGSSRSLTKIGLILGIIPTIGSLIVAVIPFTLSLLIHELGALLLFVGTVISGTFFIIIELKTLDIPKYLPLTILINVIGYFIFATLLIGEFINIAPEGSSVIWEWIISLHHYLGYLCMVFTHIKIPYLPK